jgi:hypothetical protein
MSEELEELIAAYKAKLAGMSPDERRAFEREQIAAQRESWIRAFGPCEHGDYDWETCPQCLSKYAPKDQTHDSR